MRPTPWTGLFAAFLFSGFAGLVYQLVWLRMAFARFGVITPVVSVLVSVFMLGLALGAWAGGRLAETVSRRTGLSPALLYAAIEGLIALAALAVPWSFEVGSRLLLSAGETDSAAYLWRSAIVMTLALLPACTAMGTTYPLAMAHLRRVDARSRSGFSYLYLANVVGASAGVALAAAALIELLGLYGTMLTAVGANALAALSAIVASRAHSPEARADDQPTTFRASRSGGWLLAVIFFTGLGSLGMEIAWIRSLAGVLGTYVYSFALVLFAYLWATWVGSWLYRRRLGAGVTGSPVTILAVGAVAALVPAVVNDPRLHHSAWLAVLSLVPFSLVLGYLTPQVVDRYSGGDPERAGTAYAINLLGSILGPLLAGYWLLPAMGVRATLVVLAVPLAVLALRAAGGPVTAPRALAGGLFGLGAVYVILGAASHEEGPTGEPPVIFRDHSATVVATGEGMDRQLYVNGVGITRMTPITKSMAHLPIALHGDAGRVLIIGFGMGTTYRSALSWGIETVAVELSPSVVQAFGYFFADAEAQLADPKGRIVIDDGRRYLLRSPETFAVITIDPPPPVEAAGSSLLYSREFLELVASRLAPGGILAHWVPVTNPRNAAAVANTLRSVFPKLRIFRSVTRRGYHFFAAAEPLTIPSAAAIAARVPPRAAEDLVAWGPIDSVEPFVEAVLAQAVEVDALVTAAPGSSITDDHPYTEYFLLRRRVAPVIGIDGQR